jgi:hypothetical protein
MYADVAVLSNSRDVSLPTLVVERSIKRVRRSIHPDRSRNPLVNVYFWTGGACSCAPWSRFACSAVAAIDNRTNPGKTSPPPLQAQGLASACGVGPPPTANGKSQQAKKQTLQFRHSSPKIIRRAERLSVLFNPLIPSNLWLLPAQHSLLPRH